MKTKFAAVISLVAVCIPLAACAPEPSLGLFEAACDIGETGLTGAAQYDPKTDTYRLSGSGENIWYHSDAFGFVWTRADGDLELTARVEWVGDGHEHRKAGWMIRQDTDADSAYVDALVHGSGMTAMQFRKLKDGPSDEVQAGLKAPARIRLTRRGNLFSMSVSEDGRDYEPVGSVILNLTDPVYVGLAVCSHDNAALETAVFKNVTLKKRTPIPEENRMLRSRLEIMNIQTGRRRVLYADNTHFEAPNWSPDGKTLLFNRGGKLYTLPASGAAPRQLDTGSAGRCNNDHGFSPDGRHIAMSAHDENDLSRIYILPAEGGTPRLLTPNGPSYWHGWSPDGTTLAYCALRNGQFDIYTIPFAGGPETQLTDTGAHDDGPEYAPDGRTIYFNSDREGPMLLWKMNADGSRPEPITFDDMYNDWFPHPSPDGKWIVFLSYDESVKGHPANQEVAIRLMRTPDGPPRTLTRLLGGQGTLNVNSWSPDSTQFAFVSYEWVPNETAK